MVLRLLNHDKDLARVKGREGKTPLHFAVELGNLEVMVQILEANPECIRDVTIRGQNALHIAVLGADTCGALHVLLGWLSRYYHEDAWKLERDVLNEKDDEGNTVLHIAAHLNQLETVKLLSACKRVKRNVRNLEGLTAMGVLQRECLLRQVDNRETQRILHRGGHSCDSSSASFPNSERLQSKIYFFEKILTCLIKSRLKITNEMSSTMLVVCALIITIAFQGVLAPPGGVWQVSVGDNQNTTTTTTTAKPPQPYPGQTVMVGVQFALFLLLNTFALATAAMVTVYLLPPGFLGAIFAVTLFLLFCSYYIAVLQVSPSVTLAVSVMSLLSLVYVALISYWSLSTRTLV